jgi:outer membrane receptor for ferrienterochelin and colicins
LIDPDSGSHEKAYALWNLYASKDIARGLQAYGSIDDLADSRDSLLAQNPPSYDRTDYGRTFRIGMRYTFPHE